MDAAGNRAAEGLRVVEDYTRFVLDDRHLTRLCKELRHDVAVTLSSLPPEDLHSCREACSDVGTTITTSTESTRTDLTAVVAASFKRTEQALRSLEEYGKLLATPLGTRFERLRFRAYTLERAVSLTRASIDALGPAQLQVLIPGGISLEAFTRLAESLVNSEADILQLRDKQLSDPQLLERARRLQAISRGTRTRVVVNDRADICSLAGTAGVHVGQSDLSPKDTRSIVGPEVLIGVSTHSIEQARTAVLAGANYLGVGPVFRSKTKHFDETVGTELLRTVAAEVRLPAFAIGGITLENLGDVLAAGFTRVAVGSAVVDSGDPERAAREFLSRLRAIVPPSGSKIPLGRS